MYQVFFQLFCQPPGPADLEKAREGVEALPALAAAEGLRQALANPGASEAQQEFDTLFSGELPKISLNCRTPADKVREQAFAAAQLRSTPRTVGELEVLWLLADRTAQALLDKQISEAASYSDLQGRFLASHAGECLLCLSQALRQSAATFYAQVGVALGLLVEDDLALLGYPETEPSA